MQGLQEVLFVFRVLWWGRPLGATAPLTASASGDEVGAQADLLLPQPGVTHTLCSTGPVPVAEAQCETQAIGLTPTNYVSSFAIKIKDEIIDLEVLGIINKILCLFLWIH